MHLFRSDLQLSADKLPQFQHVVHGAARVCRDQVIGEKLFFAGFLGKPVKAIFEFQQQVNCRFAHFFQDFRFAVLRGDFQLPGDMMENHFLEIAVTIFLVGQDQVVADSRSNENFLDARQLPQLFQQAGLALMLDWKVVADLGEEAALVGADAFGYFFLAFKAVHVGGRAADIRNNALEIRMPAQLPGFGDDRVFTAPADCLPLMNGNGAKITGAITTTMAGQGKLNGIHGSYPSLLLVVRVDAAFKIKSIHPIKLSLGEVECRWIMNKVMVTMALVKTTG